MYMHTHRSVAECVWSSLVPPLGCLCPLLRHALTQTPLRFIITAIILIVIANNSASCRPDRTRGYSDDQRRLKRTEDTRHRFRLEQSAKMANDSPAKSLVDIDLASLRVSGSLRAAPRGSGLAAAGWVRTRSARARGLASLINLCMLFV